MKTKIVATFVVFFACSAIAGPAPWWLWESKLNGKTTCAQTSPGDGWRKLSGPYKSDCKTPAD